MSNMIRKMVETSRARADRRDFERHLAEAVTPAARMEIESLAARRISVR